MKKTFENHLLKIECICGEKFEVYSTLNVKILNLDICFKCHPYFINKNIKKKKKVNKFTEKYKDLF